MGVSDYVAAIDLGSTKIVGCLGKKEAGGRIRILAMEQVPFKTEVRRGIVHNIEDVSKAIQDLVQLLSDNSAYPCQIDQVYVGLNGYTIRTVSLNSTSYLSGEELVNERHLDELSDDAQSRIPENVDVMDVFTQEFMVDGKPDLNPIGSMPKRVDGHYKMVGGKSNILRNLEACFNRLPIRMETILGPVASAEAVLRSDEKSKGAVCVDFGAQTTSICVYKGNLVRYVSVLPFGGYNITKDLMQLNIDQEEAEQKKIKKGTAIHYTDLKNDEADSLFEKMSDFDKEANDIMVARAEEIVDNIWAQISYSGIEAQKLTEGLVLTGGASRLQGLAELLAKKTDMPVRMGEVTQNVVSEDEPTYTKPEWALVIGLLLLGHEGCCSQPQPVVVETKKPEIPQEQTLGAGFEEIHREEPKPRETKKSQEPRKQSEPKEPKKPGRFSSIIKNLFDDEDL